MYRFVRVLAAILSLLPISALGATVSSRPLPDGSVMRQPPPDMQDTIIAAFRHMMVYPDVTIWKFEFDHPNPVGSGTVYCGHVNMQNSLRRYLGPLGFYALVQDNKVTDSGVEPQSAVQDGVGAIEYAYHQHCG